MIAKVRFNFLKLSKLSLNVGILKKLIEKARECHNHKPQPTPDTKRRKMTKTNTYKANKQMHKKHTDQLPLPQSEVITMLKGMKKHENKEHGKTLKHEAPHSINHN